MARNETDAEEIAQRVFIRAYEKLDRYNPEYKFFSWIYRMTVNESINYLKERRTHESLSEAQVSTMAEPEDEASRDASEAVKAALMELNEEDRSIVIMKHIQGMSYDEIAAILDIPEKTVKSRLYSARQRLKQILIRQGEVET